MARSAKETIVPSSPEDLKKIQGVVREIVNAKARIKGEQEYVRDAIKALTEDHNITSADIRTMIRDMSEDSFDERVSKFETYQELFLKVKAVK